MILNLDKSFAPTIMACIDFEMIKFGGGELHIKINPASIPNDTDEVCISNRIQNSDDIMEILIAKDALERLGYDDIELIIPYVPYARQDRYEIPGESFTLKVFANIINNVGFSKVTMVDAHSDVTPALIDRSSNVKNHEFVLKAIRAIMNEAERIPDNVDEYIRCGQFALISPDAGANKKINGVHSYIDKMTRGIMNPTEFSVPLIKCDKRRNMADGSLGGFEVLANDLKGKTCIIVDDICSRGGTFMGLAGALKEKNAGDIYLVVTHWENSADEEKMKAAGIKKVIKSDSMNDYSSNFIMNLKLEL